MTESAPDHSYLTTAGVKSACSYYTPSVDRGGRYISETVGSNPAGGMEVSLLRALCVVTSRSLRRNYHSSRGVLPSVACLSVIEKPRKGRLLPVIGSKCKILFIFYYIFLRLAKQSQFIPLQNVVYFISLPFFVRKIFTFYINDVLLFKCPFPRPKG